MTECFARFFKSDLQAHTPEDCRRWSVADPVRLPDPRVLADLQDKARQYLRRCHEEELEVIGITDHNFSARSAEDEWFLTHLVYQNKALAQELNRPPLVIFPGLEVDIGYHLLCLFDPGTNPRDVSECLTTLGLPPGERFSNGKPLPLRFNNQPVTLDTLLRVVQSERGGIVIAAHAFSTDGIAGDSSHAADYRHDGLLAFEVCEVPLSARAQAILLGNQPDWKRKRRPAYIMSSDCKMLRPGQNAETNFLGCRYTWVKMSQPSVISLRQAFLDQAHEISDGKPEHSRVRFGPARPEDDLLYPKIRSIRVSGAAFLEDQEHELSPNLNTLIGGRGTGKSTLIEYVRLGLDREKSIQGREPRENLDKIKQTLLPSSRVHVAFEKDEKFWEVVFDLASGPRVTQGDAIPSLSRFFPVRILSQREIYAVSEDRAARSRILDDLIRPRLDQLGREAEDLSRQIKAVDDRILRKPELEKRKQELETERLDLRGKVERLKSLESPLRVWRQRLAEESFFRRVQDEHHEFIASIERALEYSITSTVLGSELLEGPGAGTVRLVAERLETLTEGLRTLLQDALSNYRKDVSTLFSSPEFAAWQQNLEKERTEFDRLRKELSSQGTDPESYLLYRKGLQDREVQLKEIQNELDGLSTLEHQRRDRLESLEGIWKQESEAREEMAAKLTAAVPATSKGDPFVQVTVSRFGDDREFATFMQPFVKDRRRISDDDWGRFNDSKHAIVPPDSWLASIVAATPSGTIATKTLSGWIKSLRAGKRPSGCPWTPNDRRTRALLEWFTPSEEMRISLWRQPDRVKVELFRQDGTLAGELEGGLSIGQRCTAILALLLAQDDAPAILDQPEDDLDNEFVFRELVPLLRRQKENRQLIIATHNANIPVNADAELVIALEAQGGRGRVFLAHGKEAVGALDREAVRLATEEILEGSEEAFRRRFEKYGF
jgi:Skp family chaperone for outer membrane proteins